MEIRYQSGLDLCEQSVRELYSDADWSIYIQDLSKLMRAIENSLHVFTAWDGQRLVGLIRMVGDGQTIMYIQDILVLKAYKRKGIGSALLKLALEANAHVRQKVLLTDESPETRKFYEANGFQSCDKGQTVAFARFD